VTYVGGYTMGKQSEEEKEEDPSQNRRNMR
jgi:hypothetical protein